MPQYVLTLGDALSPAELAQLRAAFPHATIQQVCAVELVEGARPELRWRQDTGKYGRVKFMTDVAARTVDLFVMRTPNVVALVSMVGDRVLIAYLGQKNRTFRVATITLADFKTAGRLSKRPFAWSFVNDIVVANAHSSTAPLSEVINWLSLPTEVVAVIS